MNPKHFVWPLLSWFACLFNIRTAKAIREEIGALVDRAQAITDIASEEKRDLKPEEKTEIDGILGSGKKGTPEYKAGKIDDLERDLERAEKLEARIAENTQTRNAIPPQQAREQNAATPDPQPRVASINIPAQCRYRHGRMRSYRGEHAERTAFLAGQFLLATLYRHQPAAQWCREHGLEDNIQFRAALSGDNNSLGGFIVPQEMEQAIIDLREQYGVARQFCRVVPMAADTKDQPYRKSGLTAYFVGDNEEITASDKAWGNVKLVAKKIGALAKYSSELNEDAIISIADDLTSEIAYAFAAKEDACLFLGDSTQTYGGISGLANALQAGSIVDSLSGNTAFSTLDLVDFESCLGRLPAYSGIMPTWFISKAGWAASMLRLIDAAGGNTVREITGGSGGLQFLGYPVVFSEVLNKTLTAQTSTILAYFGDLRMASVLGNRRGVSMQLSDQRYFEYDQLAIKGTSRFDITVHSVGDATTAGAVVALKTASS